MITEKPKKRGPAPTGKGQMLGIRLHDDLLLPLDKLIADSGDAPSRPEAVRRALREYLSEKGYISKPEDT